MDKKGYIRPRNDHVRAIERGVRYRRKYGIEYEEVCRMFEAQQGCCAICSYIVNETSGLHVDHCHSTGEVRGLLCVNCNKGLGHFHDDLDKLEKAIEYLKRFYSS